MPLLSVAIPTHNRAAVLRQTLERLTQMSVPEGCEWELLVVQNNCTDDTAAMLEQFAARLPLRALTEPRPGVNHARNAAVDTAKGSYIIFTDDDTLVAEHWLSAYASAFASFPDGDIFGGPIEPRFTETPPHWLREGLGEVSTAYGALEARGRGVFFSTSFYPYGANMAFRASVLHAWPFNPELGPKGKSRINGSETDLVLKLLAKGYTGRWVEEARVEHCIQPKQMTTQFLRWYFVGHGASLAMIPPDPGTKMLWGRPRWLWRELVVAELGYRVSRPFANPKKWIRALKRASVARGQLRQRGKTFA